MIHWARINERGTLAGMQALVFIQRHLGRWPFLLVLRPVILWYFLSHTTARRASSAYLRRIDPTLAQRPLALFQQSFRHFMQFGDALMDKVAAWSDSIPEQRLRGEGFHHFGQAIQAGQGGIVLIAHHGNLDIANALAKYQSALDMTVMMHTRNASKFNALLERVTGQPRPDIMEVTDIGPATAQELAERVQRGGFVVIAADRIPVHGARLRNMTFLGEPAAFPEGPFLLAMLLRCRIYTLSCVREGDGFRIDFDPFDDVTNLPRKERETWLPQAMQRFADQLAERVRQHPLQWFNFYPFWHSDTGHAHDDNA